MYRLMFTENGRTIIRNFVEVWFFDANGRLRKLRFPPGTFVLATGAGVRRAEFVADKNLNPRGEFAVSVLNMLMFAFGAASAVVWDVIF